MQRIVFTAPTEITIGRPASIPRALPLALSRYFDRRGDVREARLAWVAFADGSVPPHHMVGIATHADWDDLVAGLSPVLSEAVPDLLIDFKQMGPEKPTTYFDDVDIFYLPSRLERLKLLLGLA